MRGGNCLSFWKDIKRGEGIVYHLGKKLKEGRKMMVVAYDALSIYIFFVEVLWCTFHVDHFGKK
jgi:hypothetical protein